MKVASVVARYLLGLTFTIFGLNGFFHFLPQPPFATAWAGDFFRVVSESHFIAVAFFFQLLAGILLLVNRFVPLALVILAAVIVNILTFHVTMDPKGIGPGIFVALLWALVYSSYRSSFKPMLAAQPETAR